MLRLHKRVSDGVKVYQKMKSPFFDCFYVMPPLTNGGITRWNPNYNNRPHETTLHISIPILGDSVIYTNVNYQRNQ